MPDTTRVVRKTNNPPKKARLTALVFGGLGSMPASTSADPAGVRALAAIETIAGVRGLADGTGLCMTGACCPVSKARPTAGRYPATNGVSVPSIASIGVGRMLIRRFRAVFGKENGFVVCCVVCRA
jgi:hypothetical protein